MSRLTDLRTIYRGLAVPLSWSKLTVMPEATAHIRRAIVLTYILIRKEEEAIERERVVEDKYKVDVAYWDSIKPVKPWTEQWEYDQAVLAWREGEPPKPWREEAEYDAAMRWWRAHEPIRGGRPPPVK